VICANRHATEDVIKNGLCKDDCRFTLKFHKTMHTMKWWKCFDVTIYQ